MDTKLKRQTHYTVSEKEAAIFRDVLRGELTIREAGRRLDLGAQSVINYALGLAQQWYREGKWGFTNGRPKAKNGKPKK